MTRGGSGRHERHRRDAPADREHRHGDPHLKILQEAHALATRLRELANAGARPFYAFTTGVAINVVVGYLLSTIVFADFWQRLGQGTP